MDPTRGERKHNGETLPHETDRPTMGVPFLRSWGDFFVEKAAPSGTCTAGNVDPAYVI